MQAITPVTTDQLLQRGQQPLLKLEIYVKGSWANICNLPFTRDLTITGLIGWWPFNENTGITAYDKSRFENDGTLYSTPISISTCDAETDWTSSKGVLSIDAVDKMEGTGSLKDTIAGLGVGEWDVMTYNPAGTWDWSEKTHILHWLKSDKANFEFTTARLFIHDILGNYRFWELTFLAGVWTAVEKLLSTGNGQTDTPPDLALINKVTMEFKAADTDAFYVKIDDLRIGYRSRWAFSEISGGCLDFDGEGDYVNCGTDADSFAMGNEDHTFSAWIYPTAVPNPYNYVVAIGNNAVGKQSGIGITDGLKLFLSAYTAPIVTTAYVLPALNAWYHIAMVYNGATDTASFYVNGAWVEDEAITLDTTVGKCFIGCNVDMDAVSLFTGKIDEVRIYNRALTPAEVEDFFELESKNYLKSISISHAGAKMSPLPIAAKFSAEINNENAIFHPKHPDSPYVDCFKAGRKVRISVGAVYGGTDYYWQRIIGYMDIPKFSGDTFKLGITGLDYMQFLTDTKLRKLDNYWGTSVTFSTVASENAYGVDEIYAELDAMEIGAGEDNNVNNWTAAGGATKASVVDGAVIGSDWSGQITFDDPPTNDRMFNDDIGNVIAGKEYRVTFYYKVNAGEFTADVNIYETGAGGDFMGGTTCPHSAAWVARTFFFTATKTGAIRMTLENFVGADALETWRIDEISVKEVTGTQNTRYSMPAASNGAYYATLDGSPVWYGVKDEGWYYDYVNNIFYFDDNKQIEEGTDNLIVYYFTDQIPEEVVADLLVTAGLYDTQADALFAMDHEATDITINNVWFKAGTSCLEAIKYLCERCDYRFYFKYNGTPVFKPFPTAEAEGSEDMQFRRWHINKPKYYEDRNEIRNRITIEGKKQAPPIGHEENTPSELNGESVSQASINEYGEHTLPIKNHLFQNQADIDDMCNTLLARYKDPKWYFDFTAPFNPAPLEIWDTIRAELLLRISTIPGDVYGEAEYDEGEYGGEEITVLIRGLIRDIKINKYNITYKNEEVT